jgi:hypothetical protein
LTKIAEEFLTSGKAEKRRLAMRQASFDNDAWWQKGKARWASYSQTAPYGNNKPF